MRDSIKALERDEVAEPPWWRVDTKTRLCLCQPSKTPHCANGASFRPAVPSVPPAPSVARLPQRPARQLL
jgi:hypothetical protein